ncbi:carbohydrate esterase family 5 protein [Camillea tinctor]|nr:carbohydrate esterase family 5 protein [Camillea tinctor]
MHSSSSAILSAAAALLPALTRAQSTGADTCTDVHTFLARGNNEPYPGRQGKLVDAICSAVGSSTCDYEDIVFDNALETEYCGAVEAGRVAGRNQIAAYHKKCPDTKLVISGYSQGAQVVGDILGGGGGTFFQGCTIDSSDGLDADSEPGNKIVAAMLFGDTRHTAAQSYNVLDGAPDNGLFPRTGAQLAGLNSFSSVLRSYCQAEDPICAGGDTVADHLNYFDVYSDAAGGWVASMVGATPSSTATSSTASQTSTMSSASTSASKSGSSTTGEASTTTGSTSATTAAPSSTTTDADVGSSESSSSSTATPTGGDQSGGARGLQCTIGIVSMTTLVSIVFSFI